jgi:HD-GYP domain-containing protein (c-di-GMP phosphodiesterase class II)
MDRRPVNITPQRVHIGAAAAQVREILAAQTTWPAPPQGTSLPVALAADPFTGDGEPAAERIRLVWQSARRLLYRILGGPFHGGWEEVTLTADGERTEVVLAAGFMAVQGADHRRLRLQLEHAARVQLLHLIDLAEGRSHRAHSVRQLLAAVSIQEETEWGHAGHSRGVERIAVGLAEAILLPPRQIAYVQQAAQLHDVGKIALDGDLWAKRGVLLASQRAALEPHVSLGAQFAARAGLPDPVVTAILHHHEQWDGRGYPAQLAGEEIPLKARVLFLAEVIDNMLRPSYRRAPLTPGQVLTRLEAGAGHQWDPQLTRMLMRQLDGHRHASTGAEILLGETSHPPEETR